ncbi:DNA helicase UvrD [Nocardioides sp. Root190]|nr:DNA helicase UvrD [Nocardioides sp. Root190]
MGVDWTFSEEQFTAVTADLEPAVIIAGAGSGKTAVMAARVLWLVANGLVEPQQVLGLTFTTKATGELQHRIRESLQRAGLLGGLRPVDDENDEPAVATYHSYASNLLREHGLRIGHEPDTRLIADAQRFQLAARAISRYDAPIDLLSDHPDTVVKALLSLDAEMSEHLCSLEMVREQDRRDRQAFSTELLTSRAKKPLQDAITVIDRRTELLGLVEGYRSLKADLGLMDFSDQIALVARLADEHPEVGAGERESYRVVLLDEYQDTSVAQALMLRRLFGGAHAVMAVGDPNQAIYGWRGASVSNILQFNLDFPLADGPAPTYQLATNRRSDRRILEVANHLAQPLLDASPSVVRLEAKPDAGEGEVRARVHNTYDEELVWLGEEVAAAHASGTDWAKIGVLVRDNRHAADVFDALTAVEIPVEIVGLKGLLRLPEVSEVLASLTLIHDVTANAALLTLLTGPRWQIGLRDLALLGSRAGELAGGRPARPDELQEQLAQAVALGDPIEVPALCDALESPGEADYSPEARERFVLLAAELRRLRTAAGEPVLDLVRRIIEVTGIDVELASSVSPAAAARRDNLDLFVKAVSEFTGLDGRTDLGALLSWLEAEDDTGQGLDVAVPTEADSVKLLTVHRSKGLEWDVVLIPGVSDKKFPVTGLRPTSLTTPGVLPTALRGDARDMPQLRAHTAAGIKEYDEDRRAHQRLEELRLGYVGWTRARHRLLVSCWRFRPGLKKGVGPSAYLATTRDAMATWGAEPDAWLEAPDDEPSPYASLDPDLDWPINHHTPEVVRRAAAAEAVRAAGPPQPSEDPVVQRWDDEIQRLLEEARSERVLQVEVPLPASLPATALSRLRDDPAAFARELARPMPRPPAPAARFGTRFHAWVEARFGQQGLFEPDDLSGRADAGIDDDSDLKELIATFEKGPFAARVPTAIEAPFALVLTAPDGSRQVVRGRIDAVYDEPDGSVLVVDWKTSHRQDADPLQLALYRLAWAELHGVAIDQVRGAFHYVRSGQLVVHDDLPDRAGIERLLGEPDR